MRNSMRLSERDAGVALDHGVLHFDRAAHRVDHAAELDDAAIAGALDDAAMVHGDGGIDQVAAQRPQPRQNSVFVGAGEPRIADHIGHQDRREFSGLAHGAKPPRPCQPFRASQPVRERTVDHWLGHGCTSMLH